MTKKNGLIFGSLLSVTILLLTFSFRNLAEKITKRKGRKLHAEIPSKNLSKGVISLTMMSDNHFLSTKKMKSIFVVILFIYNFVFLGLVLVQRLSYLYVM